MSSGLIFQHDCVIFDACCVINLYATDYMGAILKAAPVRCAICSYVKEKEVLNVRGGVDSTGKFLKIPVDLQPLIQEGILNIVVPDLSIISPYIVVLANEKMKGMGEKFTGAIARDKNWAIATDDRDTQRRFARLMPNNQLITTLELVHHWANAENITSGVLREVLIKIQTRGNAELATDHPLYNWAVKCLASSSS